VASPPRPVAFLLVALLLASALFPGSAQAATRRESGPITVTALAVEETSQGFVGVSATVQANVLAEGSGRVFVSTRPLAATDMQGSARLAAQVAASTLGVDWRTQDYLVSFSSDSAVIGGPSAGAVMTLALTTGLHNLLHPEDPWTLDGKVAATGTINPDGTIGPVGGVPAKAEGAKAAGITTFLYPAGLETATTEVAGPRGPQVARVDMATHCRNLGITCRPAARIEDLVSAAAHVALQPPDIAVPGTVDYANILGPSVTAEVDLLQAKLERIEGDARLEKLSAAERAVVDTELRDARDNLQAARDDLASEHYYAAATQAFQGAIHAGRAANITAYFAGGRGPTIVNSALQDCRDEAEAAQEAANVTAATYNAFFAVGAAQERAGGAATLYQQAQALAATDRAASIGTSVFCLERARTVTWWAGLRLEFPGGPLVSDPAATAQQAIEDARDLVTYAQAVLSSVGGNQALAQAQQKLQAAIDAQAVGWYPAAAVQAVGASSLASLAMQVGEGNTVPPAVLNAAQQGAARAISQARARGIEPVLSVSLVELAQEQDDAAASLESYWTARSLALLDFVAPPAPADAASSGPAPGALGAGGGYGGGTLVAYLFMGFALGLGGSGIVVVALLGRK